MIIVRPKKVLGLAMTLHCMRLLIFVNKFDEGNDLLGFFVGWAKELASRLGGIVVITQQEGEYNALPNLKVVVIDKKKFPNQPVRAIKFIRLLFQLRNDYDGILVIMAPAWAVLAGLVAKVLRKKTYLWYAVWRGNWKLRLAEKLVDKIFCSVKESFPFASKKVAPIGQGIDTDFFRPDETRRKPDKILYLGRVSPIKKIDVLLNAISKLKNNQPNIYIKIGVKIAGGSSNAGDEEYITSLKEITAELGITEKIKWSGRVPHPQTAAVFQEADVVVNMTPTGSFDKTMLEAMACGDLVLASNQALAGFMRPELRELLIFKQDDYRNLAQKLSHISNLFVEEKEKLRNELREIVIKNHSQKQWAENLIKNL